MTEHFLKYEQSLAVKELGFDEPCFAYFNDGRHICYTGIIKQNTNTFWHGKAITSPLKSQFLKWVRENGIEHTIVPMILDSYKEYQFVIFALDEVVETGFDTYEQAEDACIDKIIELLKNNN